MASKSDEVTVKKAVAELHSEVEKQKEIPYCTIFLVLASLTCHSLTLAGNLMMCQAVDAIGTGVGGWSKVGYGLGDALFDELDGAMRDTGNMLTTVVKEITEVSSEIDIMLSIIGHAGHKAAKMNLMQAQNPGVDLLEQFRKEYQKNANQTALLQRMPMESDLASFMQVNSSVQCSSNTCPDLMKAGEFMEDEDQDSLMQVSMQQQIGHEALGTSKHEDVIEQGQHVFVKAITDQSFARKPDGVIEVAKDWIEGLVHNVATLLDKFLKDITPCLLQIGKWVNMFSENIQMFMEQFSASIDKIEKLLDQVMHQINSGKVGQNEGVMVHQTFNIFDAKHTGCVTVADLHAVANTYGVSFLSGTKSVELVDKYDEGDKDHCLDKAEFVKMTKDPTVPAIMVMVLRQYSHMLASAAGNVKAARMRSEVATAVVQYLTLVSAKNYTKASWVSQRLTNASLPVAFTGDILAEFAIAVKSPLTVTVAHDAKVILGMMCSMNPEFVKKAYDYIAKPKNWKIEGFVPQQQAHLMSLVTKWLDEVCPATFSALQAKGIPRHELPERAHYAVAHLQKELEIQEHAANVQRHKDLFGNRGAKMMLQAVLGGHSMHSTAGGSTNPLVEQCINSGVPAVPATLEFARYLSNNATTTSHLEQQDAMDYYQDSSSPISSFANGVRGLCKKVSNFINTMQQHSTPTAIKHMESQVTGFINQSADEIYHIINSAHISLTLQSEDDSGDLMAANQASVESSSSVASEVQDLLNVMNQILPNVVGDLKTARVEISTASGFLQTVFGMLVHKGPPIFTTIANLLTMVWIAYFGLFAALQLVMLWYGFWAGGFFGGPEPLPGDAAPPASFREKCTACCRSCCKCMKECHNLHLCFWSCAIFLEILTLIAFVVSLLLCILAGVKLLLSIMCNDITFLMEEEVCLGILHSLKTFLKTFDLAWYDGSIQDACNQEKLLTCATIATEMAPSALLCCLGSVAGALLSFQLIVEAGVLHERAVWVDKRRSYLASLEVAIK